MSCSNSEYESYDDTNQWHESQLKKLWETAICEDIPEELKSEKWQGIGFQGK